MITNVFIYKCKGIYMVTNLLYIYAYVSMFEIVNILSNATFFKLKEFQLDQDRRLSLLRK